MLSITSFLKQVAKGAAVQLGVQAIVETLWPRCKKIATKILDKAEEHKNKEVLEKLAEDSKNA